MHFRVFELWRLMAAILVMMWHFLRFAPPGHEAVSAAAYRLMPLMEMFFMISGFLIMLRYADEVGGERGAYRRFIVRRIARFYPLYLGTLLFFVAIAVVVQLGIVHTEEPARYALSALPANLLLIQAWGFTDVLTFNYVAWCMSAEWFCYLVLPVVVLTFRNLGLGGLMGLAGISIAALEIATATGLIPFESWLEANTWGAYRAFADFVLGALVAMAMRGSRSTLKSYAPGWVVFAISIGAMMTKQDGYLVVGLLALAMYLIALAERNNPAGSAWLAPIHGLGKASLGIYLLHPVIETVLLVVVWKWFLASLGVINFYVYWLIPIVLTLVVAVLSERYFEAPLSRRIVALLGGRRDLKPGLAPAQ
jgi:peptidoglycan/LPS O-acetylase OafA/YrhL